MRLDFIREKYVNYLGKSTGTAPEQNQGERMVLDLIQGLKYHNIIVYNLFYVYHLNQKLLQKNLTMVGKFRKNKRNIPTKFLIEKKQPLF